MTAAEKRDRRVQVRIAQAVFAAVRKVAAKDGRSVNNLIERRLLADPEIRAEMERAE